MPGSNSCPENSTRAIQPPTCDCRSSTQTSSPRADSSAPTVSPPIPAPTTTTSQAAAITFLGSPAEERREHDHDRLDAVEDEVNYERRKELAGVRTHKRERKTQQRDHDDDRDVVLVLKDVHAREQQRDRGNRHGSSERLLDR